jgi:flavodoxin short chain
MAKVAVIYWTGSGNTEMMAKALGEGAGVEPINVSGLDASILEGVDSVALGCPAMGDEQLEDSEFEPFYQSIKGLLSGKKVGLFGSYGWGDGLWMRNWQDDVKESGAILVQDGIIVMGTPEESDLAALKELGAELAK